MANWWCGGRVFFWCIWKVNLRVPSSPNSPTNQRLPRFLMSPASCLSCPSCGLPVPHMEHLLLPWLESGRYIRLTHGCLWFSCCRVFRSRPSTLQPRSLCLKILFLPVPRCIFLKLKLEGPNIHTYCKRNPLSKEMFTVWLLGFLLRGLTM